MAAAEGLLIRRYAYRCLRQLDDFLAAAASALLQHCISHNFASIKEKSTIVMHNGLHTILLQRDIFFLLCTLKKQKRKVIRRRRLEKNLFNCSRLAARRKNMSDLWYVYYCDIYDHFVGHLCVLLPATCIMTCDVWFEDKHLDAQASGCKWDFN